MQRSAHTRHRKYYKVRQKGWHTARAATSSPQSHTTHLPGNPLGMWVYFAVGLLCALALFLALEAYHFATSGGGVFAYLGAASAQQVPEDDAVPLTSRVHTPVSASLTSAIGRAIRDEQRELAKEQIEDEAAAQELESAAVGLEGVREDGRPLSARRIAEIAANETDYTARVEEALQNPQLPSGCEPVSLTIVLRAMGFEMGLTELVDAYIVGEDAPDVGYNGSPYADGGGFPPALVAIANSYLADQGSDFWAHDLSGTSFEGLLDLTRHGYPVLVWTTMYMDDPMPTGQMDGAHEWYLNEHCVVLYGSDGEHALVSDPLEGLVERNLEDFKRIYEDCGTLAAYVR